ncbi:DUF4030 domain-containing protein [Pseudalkalibacillus hwajinpoensis]|uniref:DUF4030 domain-containing protein n=1 Tax=Guptibacillus hwajinpoensis TaxID=208199 RepID=A0A4V5Q1Y0_9BACL|nr:DUF4030 domain-containing protein [Pseudalkalibacillus hwajinpoensis]TKD71508.1 DUF4030 domain-containing protein [Pseudalkalibacillus hwajinpoensis]
MDEELKKAKVKYEDQYSDEISGKIKDGVITKINNDQHRPRWIKRVYYPISIAMIMLILFIGSAFFSPSLAGVVAEFPYLSGFFEEEKSDMEVTKVLEKTLLDIEPNVRGLDSDYEVKQITVSIIGDESYIQNVKPDIVHEVKEVLTHHNYTGFNIRVERFIPYDDSYNPSEEEKRINKEEDQISKELEPLLLEDKYDVLSYGVDIGLKRVVIDIANSESKDDIKEIKSYIKDVLAKYNHEGLVIEETIIDMEKRDQADRWTDVISVISDGLEKKSDLNVTEVAYSNNTSSITLYIKTSINSADPEKKDEAKEIVSTIEEFIESEQVALYVQEDPYKLIVEDKDGVVLLESSRKNSQ